jgi:hypothetical protein
MFTGNLPYIISTKSVKWFTEYVKKSINTGEN